MKTFAIVPAVLVLLLVAALPVAADPPQTSFEGDFEYDALAVLCSEYGYDFDVWDHVVGHESQVWHFDQDGAPVKMLKRWQGTDQLYKDTAPNMYVATGPFSFSEYHQFLNYVPGDPGATLVEAKVTGTQSNVHLPNGMMLHSAGQWVYIVQGEPPDLILIDFPKRAGMAVYDDEAICAALAQ